MRQRSVLQRRQSLLSWTSFGRRAAQGGSFSPDRVCGSMGIITLTSRELFELYETCMHNEIAT